MEKEISKMQPQLQSPMRLSRKIMKTQYTDEFGGYSKTWFSDGLQEMKDHILDDDEGMDNDATMAGGNFGMDDLARSLGLDIEAIALNLALQDDSTPPTQCRPAGHQYMGSTFNGFS